MGKLNGRAWDERDLIAKEGRVAKHAVPARTPLHMHMKLLETLRQCAHELENNHRTQ